MSRAAPERRTGARSAPFFLPPAGARAIGAPLAECVENRGFTHSKRVFLFCAGRRGRMFPPRPAAGGEGADVFPSAAEGEGAGGEKAQFFRNSRF